MRAMSLYLAKDHAMVVLYLHGEGLVEVHMADITSARRRVGEANLCVQVGAYEKRSTTGSNRREGTLPSK